MIRAEVVCWAVMRTAWPKGLPTCAMEKRHIRGKTMVEWQLHPENGSGNAGCFAYGLSCYELNPGAQCFSIRSYGSVIWKTESLKKSFQMKRLWDILSKEWAKPHREPALFMDWVFLRGKPTVSIKLVGGWSRRDWESWVFAAWRREGCEKIILQSNGRESVQRTEPTSAWRCLMTGWKVSETNCNKGNSH